MIHFILLLPVNIDVGKLSAFFYILNEYRG